MAVSSELRQRRPAASVEEKKKSNSTDDDNNKKGKSPATTKPSSGSSSRNKLLVPHLLVFCGVWFFAPVLIYVPQALWIFVQSGFDMDELLGPGIRDMVGNLVKDPTELIAWSYMKYLEEENPSPMVAIRETILQEYETYRETFEIPIISEMDPEEQMELDPKRQWKTLFLRAMGRETCAAKHFPQTMAAVKRSGFTPYSAMISRMAPNQTIEPHTGFSKMIQIYHLALRVPNNDYPTNATDAPQHKPYIRVQECHEYKSIEDPDFKEETAIHSQTCDRIETYHWKEGQEFIFDDSFPHWTHNPTNEERIIFFLHIARIDFKSWREEWIAKLAAAVFSYVPFPGVMKLVRATEATCS